MRPPVRSLLALAACAVVALMVAGHVDPVFAPLLVMLAPLLRGRYVGERLLLRLAGRRVVRRRPPACAPGALRPARRAVARGGRLLGARLAVRPPPDVASSLS